MILLQTNRLAVLLAAVVVAMLGPLIQSIGGDGMVWPSLWQPAAVPVVALLEFGLFGLLLASRRQIRSLVPVVVGALAAVFARAAAVFAGSVAMAVLHGPTAGRSLSALFVDYWMGSPLAVALQIAVLIAALPAALHAWAPGFLDRSALERLNSWGSFPAARAPLPTPQVIDAVELRLEAHAAPHARPFIYTFSELSRNLDRIVGLEGHLVLSAEGLVISGRVPFHGKAEDLAGEIGRWIVATQPLLAPGARLPRHAVLHTADHWIVLVALPEDAALTLFFTERLTDAQVAQAAARAAEAALSLFAYRYGDDDSRMHQRTSARAHERAAAL